MRRVLMMALVLLSPTLAMAGTVNVTVPDGTEVRLILKERMSSATAEQDQKVRFEVAEDVKLRGVTIIRAGAQAWGTVIETRRKGKFGKNGKLNFTIDFVKLVDDQNLRLSGAKSREGQNEYVKAGILTYATGGIGGLFVKGKDIEINAGTEYVLYTNGDRHLEIDMVLAAANSGR